MGCGSSTAARAVAPKQRESTTVDVIPRHTTVSSTTTHGETSTIAKASATILPSTLLPTPNLDSLPPLDPEADEDLEGEEETVEACEVRISQEERTKPSNEPSSSSLMLGENQAKTTTTSSSVAANIDISMSDETKNNNNIDNTNNPHKFPVDESSLFSREVVPIENQQNPPPQLNQIGSSSDESNSAATDRNDAVVAAVVVEKTESKSGGGTGDETSQLPPPAVVVVGGDIPSANNNNTAVAVNPSVPTAASSEPEKEKAPIAAMTDPTTPTTPSTPYLDDEDGPIRPRRGRRTQREGLVRTVAGKYRIIRELGTGATSQVFAAVDTTNGDDSSSTTVQVAVKLITLGGYEEMAQEQQRALAHEVEIVRSLENEAGILKVFDYGRDTDQRLYVAMELLSCPTLDASLSSSNSTSSSPLLPIPRCIEIVVALLQILEVVHAKGIIHRDIKPSNIIVPPPPSTPPIRLLDFGSAICGKEDCVCRKQRGGTPAYMSPEQARNEVDSVDFSSDLWSCGVVLFHLLANSAPFLPPPLSSGVFDDDDIVKHLLNDVIAAPIPSVRERRKRTRNDNNNNNNKIVHEENEEQEEGKKARVEETEEDEKMLEKLEVVILRAMERDKSKRFSSAAEMKEALLSVISS